MSAIPKAEESILLRDDRDGICTLTICAAIAKSRP